MSEAEVFAVAGNPVLHSRSPQIMNAAFEAAGMDAAYTRMLAGSGEEAVRTMREIGLSGMNVTSPFKKEVMGHVDGVSENAKKLEAVNTIVDTKGEFIGHNTDSEGVVGALGNAGIALEGAKAVVLGAGGAGRAAALGLVSAGSDVVIVNRTFEKAEDAAKKLGCRAAPMSRLGEELSGAGILVSCISTGERVVGPSMLRGGMAVMDANYGHPSPLAEDARKAGCTLVHGLEWLLFQAVPGFKMLTGKEAPVEAMRRAVYAEGSRPKKNIALIGFMGSGKSTVAGEIGKEMGIGSVDIDQMIVEEAGMPIAEIFRKEGESGFRKREGRMVGKISGMENKAIACGGGAILDPHNVEVLRGCCVPVWLWVSHKKVFERIQDDNSRPLLNVEGREKIAREIIMRRLARYAKAADLLVNTEGRSAEEVARMIVNETGKAIGN